MLEISQHAEYHARPILILALISGPCECLPSIRHWIEGSILCQLSIAWLVDSSDGTTQL